MAPTAHYVSRPQFEKWWQEIEAEETVIGWHNKNSWRGFGRAETAHVIKTLVQLGTLKIIANPLPPRDDGAHLSDSLPRGAIALVVHRAA